MAERHLWKLNLKVEFIKKSDKIIVIGASAGGINALRYIFEKLEAPLKCPMLVVIHRLKNVRSRMDEVLGFATKLNIKEAEDKEPLEAGTIYIAPGNYHMLVERSGHISLSVSERVNFSRPSIDVTFISVAEIYGSKATGIILTGANDDGAYGLASIGRNGGKTIVQNPKEAHMNVMPLAAIELSPNSQQMTLNEIARYLSDNYS